MYNNSIKMKLRPRVCITFNKETGEAFCKLSVSLRLLVGSGSAIYPPDFCDCEQCVKHRAIIFTGYPDPLAEVPFNSLFGFYNFLMTEIVMATCLPLKGGRVPLNAFAKGTTSKLAGFFSTLYFCGERQAEKL